MMAQSTFAFQNNRRTNADIQCLTGMRRDCATHRTELEGIVVRGVLTVAGSPRHGDYFTKANLVC